MDALPSPRSRGLESPSPQEVGRRVRAAYAYAGLDPTKPVTGLRIDPETIRQIVDPIYPRGARSEDELRQIAEATGVPVGFLFDGFMLERVGHAGPVPVPGDRYDTLRQAVADLAKELSDLRAAVVEAPARPGGRPSIAYRARFGARG